MNKKKSIDDILQEIEETEITNILQPHLNILTPSQYKWKNEIIPILLYRVETAGLELPIPFQIDDKLTIISNRIIHWIDSIEIHDSTNTHFINKEGINILHELNKLNHPLLYSAFKNAYQHLQL